MKEMLDLFTKRNVQRSIQLNEHNYYFPDEIDGIEDFFDLFEILKNAKEGDFVRLYLQCFGGRVSTGYVIINHIIEAQNNGAVVVGNIGYDCSSMASTIAMYVDDIEVSEYSHMLIHSGSQGHYGAPNENYKSILFSFQESKKELERDYKFFLTSDEIDKVINNSEPLLLNAEEIISRWDRKKQMEQEAVDNFLAEIEQPEPPEEEPEPTPPKKTRKPRKKSE